jgi:hypothetical protein
MADARRALRMYRRLPTLCAWRLNDGGTSDVRASGADLCPLWPDRAAASPCRLSSPETTRPSILPIPDRASAAFPRCMTPSPRQRQRGLRKGHTGTHSHLRIHRQPYRRIRMKQAQPNASPIPLPAIGSEPQVFTFTHDVEWLARGQLRKSSAQLAEQLHNRADPGRVLSDDGDDVELTSVRPLRLASPLARDNGRYAT